MVTHKKINKTLERIESKIGLLTKELNRVRGRVDSLNSTLSTKVKKKS